MIPFDRVLLYVDAAEGELVSARYAIMLAKNCGAQLHAVYVVNDQMIERLLQAKIFLAEEGLDMARDLEDDGRRYLNYVERMAHEKGLTISTEVLTGDPHRIIADRAAQMDMDLIIIGEIEPLRSRRNAVFGESETLLWTAPCPVLEVRGNKTDMWFDAE